MDQRKQRPKHIAAASGQAHFDGMAQADPDGINVNLDGPRLPGLRIELNVREAAAGNDQGVALFERLLRGRRAEQSNAARGVRIVVGHHCFSEQWLDDHPSDLFSEF